MIKPTVGRIVWFHQHDGVLAAIVCKVHSDTEVNLSVFSEHGGNYGALNIPLIQDGEAPPENKSYCEWMPYQIAVAKGELPPTLHA